MSRPKRPRPKCPWPKCPSTACGAYTAPALKGIKIDFCCDKDTLRAALNPFTPLWHCQVKLTVAECGLDYSLLKAKIAKSVDTDWAHTG